MPHGYRFAADGVHFEHDAHEQQVRARIEQLRTAGLTLRQIAEPLNREGATTRRGTARRHQYVAAVLRADADQLASAA